MTDTWAHFGSRAGVQSGRHRLPQCAGLRALATTSGCLHGMLASWPAQRTACLQVLLQAGGQGGVHLLEHGLGGALKRGDHLRGRADAGGAGSGGMGATAGACAGSQARDADLSLRPAAAGAAQHSALCPTRHDKMRIA